MWSEHGPTLASLPVCTPEERAMILLAYCLWNRAGGLRVAELMALDAERLALVGSLFKALSDGPDAIDDWLEWADGESSERASFPRSLVSD